MKRVLFVLLVLSVLVGLSAGCGGGRTGIRTEGWQDIPEWYLNPEGYISEKYGGRDVYYGTGAASEYDLVAVDENDPSTLADWRAIAEMSRSRRLDFRTMSTVEYPAPKDSSIVGADSIITHVSQGYGIILVSSEEAIVKRYQARDGTQYSLAAVLVDSCSYDERCLRNYGETPFANCAALLSSAEAQAVQKYEMAASFAEDGLYGLACELYESALNDVYFVMDHTSYLADFIQIYCLPGGDTMRDEHISVQSFRDEMEERKSVEDEEGEYAVRVRKLAIDLSGDGEPELFQPELEYELDRCRRILHGESISDTRPNFAMSFGTEQFMEYRCRMSGRMRENAALFNEFKARQAFEELEKILKQEGLRKKEGVGSE